MYFRSPIALSINEDDEENLEDVIENGNQNGGIEEEYELLPKPLNTKSRRLKRQVLYNSYSGSNMVVPKFEKAFYAKFVPRNFDISVNEFWKIVHAQFWNWN